jgi:hypothetical protein
MIVSIQFIIKITKPIIKKIKMKKINKMIIHGKRKKSRKKIISKKVIKLHQLKNHNQMTKKANNKMKVEVNKMIKKSLLKI